MAPKRKAEELANAVNAMQSAASKQTVADDKASGAAVTCCQPKISRLHSQHRPSLELTCALAGTLAGASGQSVDTLLDRIGNRRQRALAAKVQTVCFCMLSFCACCQCLTEESMIASYGSNSLPWCHAPDLLLTPCQGCCSMMCLIAM